MATRQKLRESGLTLVEVAVSAGLMAVSAVVITMAISSLLGLHGATRDSTAAKNAAVIASEYVSSDVSYTARFVTSSPNSMSLLRLPDGGPSSTTKCEYISYTTTQGTTGAPSKLERARGELGKDCANVKNADLSTPEFVNELVFQELVPELANGPGEPLFTYFTDLNAPTSSADQVARVDLNVRSSAGPELAAQVVVLSAAPRPDLIANTSELNALPAVSSLPPPQCTPVRGGGVLVSSGSTPGATVLRRLHDPSGTGRSSLSARAEDLGATSGDGESKYVSDVDLEEGQYASYQLTYPGLISGSVECFAAPDTPNPTITVTDDTDSRFALNLSWSHVHGDDDDELTWARGDSNLSEEPLSGQDLRYVISMDPNFEAEKMVVAWLLLPAADRPNGEPVVEDGPALDTLADGPLSGATVDGTQINLDASTKNATISVTLRGVPGSRAGTLYVRAESTEAARGFSREAAVTWTTPVVTPELVTCTATGSDDITYTFSTGTLPANYPSIGLEYQYSTDGGITWNKMKEEGDTFTATPPPLRSGEPVNFLARAVISGPTINSIIYGTLQNWSNENPMGLVSATERASCVAPPGPITWNDGESLITLTPALATNTGVNEYKAPSPMDAGLTGVNDSTLVLVKILTESGDLLFEQSVTGDTSAVFRDLPPSAYTVTYTNLDTDDSKSVTMVRDSVTTLPSSVSLDSGYTYHLGTRWLTGTQSGKEVKDETISFDGDSFDTDSSPDRPSLTVEGIPWGLSPISYAYACLKDEAEKAKSVDLYGLGKGCGPVSVAAPNAEPIAPSWDDVASISTPNGEYRYHYVMPYVHPSLGKLQFKRSATSISAAGVSEVAPGGSADTPPNHPYTTQYSTSPGNFLAAAGEEVTLSTRITAATIPGPGGGGDVTVESGVWQASTAFMPAGKVQNAVADVKLPDINAANGILARVDQYLKQIPTAKWDEHTNATSYKIVTTTQSGIEDGTVTGTVFESGARVGGGEEPSITITPCVSDSPFDVHGTGPGCGKPVTVSTVSYPNVPFVMCSTVNASQLTTTGTYYAELELLYTGPALKLTNTSSWQNTIGRNSDPASAAATSSTEIRTTKLLYPGEAWKGIVTVTADDPNIDGRAVGFKGPDGKPRSTTSEAGSCTAPGSPFPGISAVVNGSNVTAYGKFSSVNDADTTGMRGYKWAEVSDPTTINQGGDGINITAENPKAFTITAASGVIHVKVAECITDSTWNLWGNGDGCGSFGDAQISQETIVLPDPIYPTPTPTEPAPNPAPTGEGSTPAPTTASPNPSDRLPSALESPRGKLQMGRDCSGDCFIVATWGPVTGADKYILQLKTNGNNQGGAVTVASGDPLAHKFALSSVRTDTYEVTIKAVRNENESIPEASSQEKPLPLATPDKGNVTEFAPAPPVSAIKASDIDLNSSQSSVTNNSPYAAHLYVDGIYQGLLGKGARARVDGTPGTRAQIMLIPQNSQGFLGTPTTGELSLTLKPSGTGDGQANGHGAIMSFQNGYSGPRWIGPYWVNNALTYCIDLGGSFPAPPYGGSYSSGTASGQKKSNSSTGKWSRGQITSSEAAQLAYVAWLLGAPQGVVNEMLGLQNEFTDNEKRGIASDLLIRDLTIDDNDQTQKGWHRQRKDWVQGNSSDAWTAYTRLKGTVEKKGAVEKYAGPWTVSILSPSSVRAGSATQVQVKVTSATGRAVPGVWVGISGNLSPNTSRGDMVAKTDSNGVANLKITLDCSATVTAWVLSAPIENAKLWIPGFVGPQRLLNLDASTRYSTTRTISVS